MADSLIVGIGCSGGAELEVLKVEDQTVPARDIVEANAELKVSDERPGP